MHHLPLLQDMLILLGLSVVIVYALQKIKVPSIIGFLLTGVIIGPYGFSLINAVDQVEVLSEIGVILLLFVIGMELSIKQLASIKKTVFIGGALQVGVTAAVASVSYQVLGNPWNESVFVGFLFSLSSTAIVLKTLQDRRQISAPHGRNALGILIFQDIIVVPMMLVTPIMAGASTNIAMSIATLLGKSLIVVAITYVSARFIVPRVLYSVAKTNSKELFLLVTITLCFAVAFLTSEAGLSLALGAFLAGLILSESEYSHQATSVILPFRELFTSIFFVSIGMLLQLQFFVTNIGVILGLVALVFVVKSLIAAMAVAVLRYPPRTLILTGLALFQVGEFAFILSKVGLQYELLTPETNQYFLSVSILSMMLTPLVIIFSETIADRLAPVTKVLPFGGQGQEPATLENPGSSTSNQRAPGDSASDSHTPGDTTSHSPTSHDHALQNHLVIIGYGINGSNLAKAAAASNIPYIVIETNPETVQRERAKGVPILYGDATEEHILEIAHIDKARVAVVAISDLLATRYVIKAIRSISDSVHLVVRTRYVKETTELLALGADEVIPEEFETSVQIFTGVLHNFLVPEDDIDQFVEAIRSDNYQLFNREVSRPKTYRPTELADFNITCLRIHTDSRRIVGKSLQELNLRATYGLNILGIKRGETMLERITPEETLKQGDIVYIQGDKQHIAAFHKVVG